MLFYHVYSRNANNDGIDKWFTNKDKAVEALRSAVERMNLVESGITDHFYCYVGNHEIYEDDNGLDLLNAEKHTDYKDWVDAVVGEGSFTGECGSVNCEAYMEEHEGEMLPDGKAAIKMVVNVEPRTFHYDVHVRAVPNKNKPSLDMSIWVGLTLDHKCDPDSSICDPDSELGVYAISRARELCPILRDYGCMCEEWSRSED